MSPEALPHSRTLVCVSRGAVVLVYRVYSLNRSGRIGLAEEVRAESDDAAMALARELVPNAVKGELWQDRRLVATLSDQGWMIDQP